MNNHCIQYRNSGTVNQEEDVHHEREGATVVIATTRTARTTTRRRRRRAVPSVSCQSSAKYNGGSGEKEENKKKKEKERWADLRPRNWATFAGSDLQTMEEEYEYASKSGLGPRFGGYNAPELSQTLTRMKSNANFFKVNYIMYGLVLVFVKTLISVSIYSNNPLPTLSVLALGVSLVLGVDCCVEALNRVVQSSGLGRSTPSCEVIYNTMGERFTSFKLSESETKILSSFGLLVAQVVSAVFCISFCPIYETYTAVSDGVTLSLYLSIAHAVCLPPLNLHLDVHVCISADNYECYGVEQRAHWGKGVDAPSSPSGTRRRRALEGGLRTLSGEVRNVL